MEDDQADHILLIKAAQRLRHLLLDITKTCRPLPLVLTSTHFKKGLAPVPKVCNDFCLELLCTNPTKPSEKEKRLANSLGSDMLYGVTKGYAKPAKQLCMGVGIKSMTGSALVCRILHRLGQSISCTEEQGITTEMAEVVTSCNIILPDGLYMEAGLATSACYDNFDMVCLIIFHVS